VDPETELVTCHRCGATHRQDTEVISELRRQRVRLDMLYTCWCPNCSFERDAREAIIVQLAELLSLQANLGSLYPHPGPPSLPLQ
jgi:hypothetical protein